MKRKGKEKKSDKIADFVPCRLQICNAVLANANHTHASTHLEAELFKSSLEPFVENALQEGEECTLSNLNSLAPVLSCSITTSFESFEPSVKFQSSMTWSFLTTPKHDVPPIKQAST